MHETMMLGRGRKIIKVSRKGWERYIKGAPLRAKTNLTFMSEQHKLVRNYVVRELPHANVPLEPDLISERVNLTLEQVTDVLDELEKKLFFLVRNKQGAVTWAYPLTVEQTPHYLTFSSGEQLYAA